GDSQRRRLRRPVGTRGHASSATPTRQYQHPHGLEWMRLRLGTPLTERDTDIEFDFFDEPETEEATERARTPRRPPPRGPRRPVRPPAGVIPMLRLAGLIAFLILAVVLLVVAVRGCASNSKHDRYAHYITDIRRVAADSTSIGQHLNQTLAATGQKASHPEA